MVNLKTKEQIEEIKKAAKILIEVRRVLEREIRPGISTKFLDDIASKFILERGGSCAFKGYRGFPANICTSINEEVVHGIPSASRILKNGDILSLDIGVNLNGYFADLAFTVGIGKIGGRIRRLLEVTKKALDLGIRKCKCGNFISDISWTIQKYVESNGFSVVRDFVGHGTGFALHEAPEIPNFASSPDKGERIKKGMVLAIETMVNMGTWEVEILSDGWTAVTKDRLPSCHFEHTVAITEDGPEILTRGLTG
jgi:methionyl aminopeptidase